MKFYVNDKEVKDLAELKKINDDWFYCGESYGFQVIEIEEIDLTNEAIYFRKADYEC